MTAKNRPFHNLPIQHLFVFHSRRMPERGEIKAGRLDLLCPEQYRAVTVCVAFDGSGRHAVGVATCSQADQFSRKLGRAIATGRALKELAGYLKIVAPCQLSRKEAAAIAVRAAGDRLRELGGAKATEAGAQ